MSSFSLRCLNKLANMAALNFAREQGLESCCGEIFQLAHDVRFAKQDQAMAMERQPHLRCIMCWNFKDELLLSCADAKELSVTG